MDSDLEEIRFEVTFSLHVYFTEMRLQLCANLKDCKPITVKTGGFKKVKTPIKNNA